MPQKKVSATINVTAVVDGKNGAEGNGIQSVARTYAVSSQATTASDTTPPSDVTSWAAASPATTVEKPYLWAKEVVTYTKTASTTKYYMIGARGQNGIDAQDFEWAYIRTKTNTAPVIATDSSYTDSKGKAYTADDHLPHVTGNSNIESNNSGVSGKTYECTDDPKGVNDTWPYEWEIKREKGAADGNGHRAWQPYSSARPMTLHNNLAASLLTIDIDNDSDQFGVDADGKVLAQQARSTVVTMDYGTEPQAFTSAPTASLRYDDGTTVASSVATAAVSDVSPSDAAKTQYRVTVTVKATGTNTPVFGTSGKNGLYVDISGTCARDTKTIRFSLAKAMGGESGVSPSIYQLLLSCTKVSFARNSSNVLTPSSVYVRCGYTKTTGATIEKHVGDKQADLQSIDSKYNILYRPIQANGTAGSWAWMKDLSSANFYLTILNSTTHVAYEFVLTTAGSVSSVADSNIVDRETLPILKDGAKGQDGQDGKDGTNSPYLKSHTIMYALNNDGNTAPASGWGTALLRPSVTNKYLWRKDIYEYDANERGRNLLRGTSDLQVGSGTWSTGSVRMSGQSAHGTISRDTTQTLPITGITSCIKISKTGGGTSEFGFAQDYVPLTAGKKIMMSCWIKGTAGAQGFLQPAWINNIRAGSKTYTCNGEWQYVTCEGTLGDYSSWSAGYVYLNTQDATVYVCGLKLEYGDGVTDWMPAPEDLYREEVSIWSVYGVSITSANVYYALSTAGPTSTPPADAAFTYDDFPNGNLQPGYYVWQATKVEYSEGEPQFTGKMCLGATTDFLQGAEVYAVSQSGTTVPQTWATSYTIRNGYYLWTATKVTYTNGHVGYLNPKCVGYWGEDGIPTPYYFEETFAWSNQPSTVSSTTPPNDISSTDWKTSIPAQGTKKYLWRKSIRHVWNTSSKSYDAEAAQYFRMSGLDGTGIDIKGAVERYSHMEADGHVTPEGGSRRQAANGDCYVLHEHYSGSDGNDKYGHLFQWNTEAGTWVDIGQFQGQPGVTYYTHVAWATSVIVNSSGQATSVQGFITTKSPNDTAHDWMGVYVDTNSGQDSNNALHYTWTYTKGQQGDPGDDAVVYSVQCSPAAVNFRSDAVGEFSGNYTVGCKVMKTVGNNTTEVAASSGTYDGMYLKCRKLNTSGNYTSWDAASSATLTPSDALTNNYVAVEFALSANSGMTAVKARASVPIMCDGHRGAPGAPGGVGATGRMFRPRGTYNGSATYVRNNDFVDLVFFDDRVRNNANGARGHYYYISDGYSGNVSGSTHYAPAPTDGDGNSYPYSEGVWSIASDFGVVITQAIFAEFAKMGSAIITGDWMLSQHGTADGVFYDSHKVLVAFMVGSQQKTSIHPYTLFDGSSPTGGLVSVATYNTTISSGETSHNIISVKPLKSGLCYKITCRVPDGYEFSGVPLQIQIDKASTYDPITLLTVSEEETVYTTYVMVPANTTYRLRLVRSSTASQNDTISTVIEQVTFAPQYAVDLLTGLTYMVDAYVKGDVIRPVLTMTQDNSAQYVIHDSAAPATGGNLFFVDLPRAFRTVQIAMIQDGDGNLPPSGVAYILLPEVMPQDVGVEMTILNGTTSGALTMVVRSGDSNPKGGGYGSINRWLLNGFLGGNINAYPVESGGDLRTIGLSSQQELRLRAVQLPSANNVNTGNRGWIALGQPYNICKE